ncbi:MAG: hypothetical protein AAB307_02320, partial [Deltaproteobacteria bacterium]
MIKKALLLCLPLIVLLTAPFAPEAGSSGNGGIPIAAGSSGAEALSGGVSGASKCRRAGFFKDSAFVVPAAEEDDRPAIGVLLPLKGSYARYAEDAMDGVLLAADVFGKGVKGDGACDGGGRVEVFVRNVGSDPAQVEAAVDGLAA